MQIDKLKDIPRIGPNRQKYDNPTAASLLVLLREYSILFDGQNRYHLHYNKFQEERLGTLLYLLDVEERCLFEP